MGPKITRTIQGTLHNTMLFFRTTLQEKIIIFTPQKMKPRLNGVFAQNQNIRHQNPLSLLCSPVILIKAGLVFGLLMRLNIQTDNGQTIYKNRTQTHNLQQSVQETNPIVSNKQPRRPVCYKSDLQVQIATSSDNPGNEMISVTIAQKDQDLINN